MGRRWSWLGEPLLVKRSGNRDHYEVVDELSHGRRNW